MQILKKVYNSEKKVYKSCKGVVSLILQRNSTNRYRGAGEMIGAPVTAGHVCYGARLFGNTFSTLCQISALQLKEAIG